MEDNAVYREVIVDFRSGERENNKLTIDEYYDGIRADKPVSAEYRTIVIIDDVEKGRYRLKLYQLIKINKKYTNRYHKKVITKRMFSISVVKKTGNFFLYRRDRIPKSRKKKITIRQNSISNLTLPFKPTDNAISTFIKLIGYTENDINILNNMGSDNVISITVLHNRLKRYINNVPIDNQVTTLFQTLQCHKLLKVNDNYNLLVPKIFGVSTELFAKYHEQMGVESALIPLFNVYGEEITEKYLKLKAPINSDLLQYAERFKAIGISFESFFLFFAFNQHTIKINSALAMYDAFKFFGINIKINDMLMFSYICMRIEKLLIESLKMYGFFSPKKALLEQMRADGYQKWAVNDYRRLTDVGIIFSNEKKILTKLVTTKLGDDFSVVFNNAVFKRKLEEKYPEIIESLEF